MANTNFWILIAFTVAVLLTAWYVGIHPKLTTFKGLRMEVSDNVYADLGFENSSEMQAKSTVVAALSAKLRAGGIGLDQAAQQLQIDAAGLEKILRGQFRNVSLEKLTAMSEKLDSFPNYAAAGLKNCPNCEVGHLHQDTREMATRDKRRVEKNSNVHPT